MKKIYALLICFALLLSAGCSADPVTKDTTNITRLPTQTSDCTTQQPEPEETVPNDYVPVQVPMAAISLPVSINNEYTEDDILLYSYKCQTVSLIIPDSEIEHNVIIDLQTRLDSFNIVAQEIRDRAKNDYTGTKDWNNYFYEILYTPTRIDLSVLSLYGEITSWGGGAHPSKSCISSNYDMTTGDILTLGTILTHEDKLDALCNLLIDEVADIKAEKYLYTDYSDIIRSRFAQNESYNESWFFSGSGLCFHFSPYEIAPYSSGVITITIPYEKLTGIIEDRYFPAERDVANGTVRIVKEDEAGLTAFSQIAEVILDGTGEMLFIYTDRSVQDVSINIGTTDTAGNFVKSFSIFATPILTPGDAVMLQNLWDPQETIELKYMSNNKEITKYIFCDTDSEIQIVEN